MAPVSLHHVIAASVLAFLMTSRQVHGKTIFTATEDVMHNKTHGCGCTVSVANSSGSSVDLGEVAPRLSASTASCHALRHRCHAACARAAGELGRRLEREGGGGSRLGYELCATHDKVLHGPGAALLSQGRLLGARRECSLHRHMRPAAVAGGARLCCGHAIVPVPGEKYIRAFGWDPNCDSREFVLA